MHVVLGAKLPVLSVENVTVPPGRIAVPPSMSATVAVHCAAAGAWTWPPQSTVVDVWRRFHSIVSLPSPAA